MLLNAEAAREEFRDVVSGWRDDWLSGETGYSPDLWRAGLLCAAVAGCPTDPDECAGLLGEMADSARALRTGPGLEPALSAIRETLFVRGGFTGNDQDYYDPRNSFLPDVLRRRTGIPITLSLVVHEVAFRLGLTVLGANFPGHFLIWVWPEPHPMLEFLAERGADLSQTEWLPMLLDPFFGLRKVGKAEQAELLKRTFGREDVELENAFLRPLYKHQWLVRLLNNLRQIYTRRAQWSLALTLNEMMVEADPLATELVRDRGALRQRTGDLRGAISDLKYYLETCPSAPDEEPVRAHLQGIVDYLARMN